LIVAPAADPSRIRIHAPQAKIQHNLSSSRETKISPVVSNKSTVRIRNRRLRQIVDPVIESREYIGGIGDDSVTSIGPAGRRGGTTTSVDSPGTPANARRGTDVFLRTKDFTMIMGGSGDETAAPSEFGGDNPSFTIAGTTNSKDLPTTTVTRGGSTFPHSPESLKDFAGGATDGFVWIVSNIGGRYASSVDYIGTDGDDRINAVIVAGSTNGTYAFPTTSNSWARRGGRDAFVLRVATSYTNIALQAAFYIGGNGDDEPYALARAEGKILVAGETSSSDFPLVGRPIQSQRKGSSDAFIASFDEIETTLLTSSPWRKRDGPHPGNAHPVGIEVYRRGNHILA
jgi:hypothetical protein